jgi:Cu(I)/Ag(I) efflux system periplasmic protein CusF
MPVTGADLFKEIILNHALTLTLITVTLITAALAMPAYAQQNAADHSTHQAAPATASAALSEGEIRKVDRDAQKITIRHGPIANLNMPPMTMVFQVRDAALLDRAKTGDKVRFAAEQSGGAYIVTRIDPAQ